MVGHDADDVGASRGCLPPRFQEQERCTRLYERGRDSRGRHLFDFGQSGLLTFAGLATRQHSHAQMAHYALLCHDWSQPPRRTTMGRTRCKRSIVPLLNYHAGIVDLPTWQRRGSSRVLYFTRFEFSAALCSRVNKELYNIGTRITRLPQID